MIQRSKRLIKQVVKEFLPQRELRETVRNMAEILEAKLALPTLVGNRDALVIISKDSYNQNNAAIILSNFEGASEMRFGNTLEEMQLSQWEPYTNRRFWFLPANGVLTFRVVYAQFKGPALEPFTMKLPIYTFDAGLENAHGAGVDFLDPRYSNDILTQDFATSHEGWSSYKKVYGRSNLFFPMSHHLTGGVDNGGYVWTDDSRWEIDYPEQPNSILVALNYYHWLSPPNKFNNHTGLDFRNKQLEVYLRGKNLKLGDAHVTFWVICGGARWHLISPYLNIQEGEWTYNKILLEKDKQRWMCSWARNGRENARLALHEVTSFGFAFRGFPQAENVKGIFEMDKFKISQNLSSS